ncbi:mitochondrial potassium channel-like isoform X2 [Hetaerina americana]
MHPPVKVYCRLIFRGLDFSHNNILSVRFASAKTQPSSIPNEHFFAFQWWRTRLLRIQLLYDEITGLKEVHDAQTRVLDAEKHFVLAQEERRNIQTKLAGLQKQLKQIYAELDKTPRGEERYVQLITMEHAVIKEEKMINEVFHQKEREERDHFSALSSAVKMGHEKERAQAERTKYWSIIGSVFGTLLGMLASSIMNDLRMRELRNIVGKSVNVDVEKRKEYSELLIENKNKLEILVASVQQLNETAAVHPKPVEAVKLGHDALIPNALITSLVVSAIVIFIKAIM